jgi:molybdopterin molybdotransferase
MTGAFVPEGADAVVQVEWTDGGRETVHVQKPVRIGQNIRRRGEDMRAGDLVLRSGAVIGPAEMAMLANARKPIVRVSRKPVVAILSTGDELVEIDAPLTPGKIVNTNSYLLAALVRAAGATPRILGIVRDTREATIAALESALESDFVISSGGVSVGAFDFVKEALDAVGAETKFWQVAMKPGKPVVLSRARDRVVFGLPGNPVSCFVSFHLFVAPALRKAMGQEEPLFPPSVHARLTAPLKSIGDRRVYVRVRLAADDGELVATPLASQGSGSLTSMIGANGLAILSEGVRGAEAGTMVPVVVIGALHRA